jgi:hypothetical protein
MWQGWINGILGLWLIVAAFVITGSQTGNQVNGIIVGIVLWVLGLWAAIRRKSWHDWLVTFIGLWIFIAAFWFPSSHWGNVVNDLAAGVVVAIVSFWPSFSCALRAKQEN